MNTLVIDTGQSIIGIFTVNQMAYDAYHPQAYGDAIARIQTADEIVVYGGTNWNDMRVLASIGGPSFQVKGAQIDMRTICWSNRIFGSSLTETYNYHFSDCPAFPATYRGDNERDVYMTYKLWQLWKSGNLRIVDGAYRS